MCFQLPGLSSFRPEISGVENPLDDLWRRGSVRHCSKGSKQSSLQLNRVSLAEQHNCDQLFIWVRGDITHSWLVISNLEMEREACQIAARALDNLCLKWYRVIEISDMTLKTVNLHFLIIIRVSPYACYILADLAASMPIRPATPSARRAVMPRPLSSLPARVPVSGTRRPPASILYTTERKPMTKCN